MNLVSMHIVRLVEGLDPSITPVEIRRRCPEKGPILKSSSIRHLAGLLQYWKGR